MSEPAFSLADGLAIERLMRQVAAEEILPRFGVLSADTIRAKTTPDDLVTIADLEAERRLAAGLSELFPQSAVIGEESAGQDFDYARDRLLFVIDPVDGTWNFANNLPVFGSMVSVLSHGEEIAGLIHYPMQGDTLIGLRGQGVHRIDAAGGVSKLPRLGDTSKPLLTGFIPFSLYAPDNRIALMKAFRDLARLVTIQCSAYEYRLLVEGKADFCLSTGLKPWDHSAGQLMLQEIGGVGMAPDGEPWSAAGMKQNLLVSAATPSAWSEVAGRLTDFRFDGKVTSGSE